MAKDLLKRVCLCRGEEIHLVLDKYQSPSTKDPERNLRCSTSHEFFNTGPDQAQCQRGKELLKSSSSKEQFTRFFMKEWRKPQYEYGQAIGQKKLHVSHGGSCKELRNDHNHLQALRRVTSKAIII